jgi:hypothetical protein
MQTLGNFITWLNQNAQTLSIVVAILVALIPAIWSLVSYLNLKSKELRHERFKIYHGLIRELVQPDSPGQPMSMDRQIAIVFELRNFKEYYELTLRMLEGLCETWNRPPFYRLTQEIRHTIKYIEKNSKLQPNKRIQPIANAPADS